MDREIVSRVFRRDFQQILNFDIFEFVDDHEYLVEKGYFSDLYLECFTIPIKRLTHNLLEIVVTYLEYDPKRFPKPMDQYVYIYENQDKILEILERDLKVEDPFVCPLSYSLCARFTFRFNRLFRNILTVGQTHKFDEDYIFEHILVDSDGQDTD